MMLKRYFFFLTSIMLVIFFYNANAQNINETLAYARSLSDEGMSEDAVEAYRRVLFFAPELTDSIARETGNAYRKTANYDKAVYYYNIALHNESDLSLKGEIKFDIIQSYILNKDYMKAKLQLANMKYSNMDYSEKEFAFYQSITSFETDDYELSRESVLIFLGECDTTKIESLFAQAEKNYGKNPETAMWLSLFPGLGQAYVNEYGEAANSFLINSVFLSLYFYVALTYNPIQGFIAVLPWFQRYYIGGMQNARSLAKEKKREEKDRILKEILEYSRLEMR